MELNNQKEEFKEKIMKYSSLEILDSTDLDICPCGIGGRIWKSAVMLSNVLSNESLKKFVNFEDKVVLEIGAGCGIGGLIASKLKAKKVYLTDNDPGCLEVMKHNYEVNKERLNLGEVEVFGFDWGNRNDYAKFSDKIDIIIGSDIIYALFIVDGLIRALDNLCDVGMTFLLAYHRRGPESETFLEKIEATKKWKIENVSQYVIDEEFLRNGVSVLVKIA
jgi:predicted nicotinamide N-methyase